MPQLVCVGRPCKLYTPEAVRCVNLGSSGSSVDSVDWKCTADLPSSLRFGKVEVSCEGWSKPGDSFVLKGSCGLTYRLVEVPGALRDDQNGINREPWDVASTVFFAIWIAVLAVILWSFLKSCFGRDNRDLPRRTDQPPPARPDTSFWFPGAHPDDRPEPPPPYSKNGPESSANQGWRPGFWTGAALGGLGAHLWNQRRNVDRQPENLGRRSWDWENPLRFRQPSSGMWGGGRTTNSDDRGEGPSNLGPLRQSTGYGGTTVR